MNQDTKKLLDEVKYHPYVTKKKNTFFANIYYRCADDFNDNCMMFANFQFDQPIF